MTLIDQYIGEIQRLCSQHQVKRLYAFGSVLTQKIKKDSDIDFIVEFKSFDLNHYADNYYDLKFALEEALHRSVDLLEEQAIKNPYFREAIENQRQLIYGN